MRALAVAAIGAYQRYLSPHKGFCCAYRQHTGAASCSALGLRAIRRHGLLPGTVLLRQRLQRCSDMHRQCRSTRPPAPQRGDCDLGCVPGLDLDLPCDCCDCDWPSSREKKKQKKSRR